MSACAMPSHEHAHAHAHACADFGRSLQYACTYAMALLKSTAHLPQLACLCLCWHVSWAVYAARLLYWVGGGGGITIAFLGGVDVSTVGDCVLTAAVFIA